MRSPPESTSSTDTPAAGSAGDDTSARLRKSKPGASTDRPFTKVLASGVADRPEQFHTSDVFRKYANHLLYRAAWKTRNNATAEDLVQTAFVRRAEYLSKGKEIRDEFTWLRKVLDNLVIDFYKKHENARCASREPEETDFDPKLSRWDTNEGYLGDELRDAVSKLGPRQQEVVYCIYGLGLGGTETAERMNLTPKMVSKLKVMALAQLKKSLCVES